MCRLRTSDFRGEVCTETLPTLGTAPKARKTREGTWEQAHTKRRINKLNDGYYVTRYLISIQKDKLILEFAVWMKQVKTLGRRRSSGDVRQQPNAEAIIRPHKFNFNCRISQFHVRSLISCPVLPILSSSVINFIKHGAGKPIRKACCVGMNIHKQLGRCDHDFDWSRIKGFLWIKLLTNKITFSGFQANFDPKNEEVKVEGCASTTKLCVCLIQNAVHCERKRFESCKSWKRLYLLFLHGFVLYKTSKDTNLWYCVPLDLNLIPVKVDIRMKNLRTIFFANLNLVDLECASGYWWPFEVCRKVFWKKTSLPVWQKYLTSLANTPHLSQHKTRSVLPWTYLIAICWNDFTEKN